MKIGFVLLMQTESTFAFLARSSVSGFTNAKLLNNNNSLDRVRCRQRQLYMISDNPFAEEKTTETEVLKDKSGNVFEVGGVIRVALENVKAYQVPADGQGSFNDDKQFVQAPEDAPRGAKNLVLPVGIRGVITKVYDTTDVSANFPIQVKFTPGENVDEGYDPPVPFIMHLSPREIECT